MISHFYAFAAFGIEKLWSNYVKINLWFDLKGSL